MNGGLFLSWRDNHYHPHRSSRHRAKSWRNKRYRRHYNAHRHSRHKSPYKTRRQDHRDHRLAAKATKTQRPSRRHHAADAFNQPMLENQQARSPRRHAQVTHAEKNQGLRSDPHGQTALTTRLTTTVAIHRKTRHHEQDRRPGRHEQIR